MSDSFLGYSDDDWSSGTSGGSSATINAEEFAVDSTKRLMRALKVEEPFVGEPVVFERAGTVSKSAFKYHIQTSPFAAGSSLIDESPNRQQGVTIEIRPNQGWVIQGYISLTDTSEFLTAGQSVFSKSFGDVEVNQPSPRILREVRVRFPKIIGRDQRRFTALSKKWKSQTAYLSSVDKIVLNPNYQQIIGMGQAALPFIFQELSKETNHWFWALKAITGKDPVSEEHRGNMEEMRKEWLSWGAMSGYFNVGKLI